MQLTRKTIEFLNSEDGLRCRNRLALELNKSQYTIQRYIHDNDDELTKAAALRIISDEIKLPTDKILTEQNAA